MFRVERWESWRERWRGVVEVESREGARATAGMCAAVGARVRVLELVAEGSDALRISRARWGDFALVERSADGGVALWKLEGK